MVRYSSTLYIAFAWVLLFVGAIISIWFLVLNSADYTIGEGFDYEKTGQFGDYIGGVVGTVFALAGTILVFASFVQQQHRNTIESFEKNYFEMLRVHEDIVREMNYGGKSSRAVFPMAIEQLSSIYSQVFSILEDIEQQLKDGELKNIGISNEALKKFMEDGDNKILANFLSVGFLYYGTEQFYLSSKKDDPFYAISELVKEYMPDFGYEPMDNVLGHYYRQMYQTVKYVVKADWLKEEERYDYVKLLRSQLSDYEQMMLFYNAMSVNGYAWKESKSDTEIKEMNLIARFRLIKNIPYHCDYFFIHPKDVFSKEENVWKEKGKRFFENEIYTI